MLMDMGKPAEAEAEFRTSLACHQQLSDDNPTVTELRRKGWLQANGGLGYVLRRTGKPLEAMNAARRRRLLSQKAGQGDNPKVPDYRDDVALALLQLGEVVHMLGREAEARDGYQRAVIALSERLMRGENPDPGRCTAVHLALAFWRAGWPRRPARPRRSCGRRPAGGAEPARRDCRRGHPSCEFEGGHCQRGRSRDLAGQDGAGVSAAEAKAEAGQAMTLLRKAVGMGYRDAGAFRTESALDPLRQREDFKKLLEEVEKKTTATPE